MLTQDGENILQVIGIYALHAPQMRDPVASNWPLDLTYVGKASAMKPDVAGAIVARRRPKQHFQEILHGIIQWDVIARLLHKYGVDKGEVEIRRVHTLCREIATQASSRTL